ncbi:hypothetical protein [Litchfieldia salsa]|uniref:Uncharacterized protein n=1 Tax=Litchfieldia salsa TaxID=930152 RepID=A0A1H0WZV9_9BACI|nr:hypothetical protein [Litchfieldia salsa]SDP96248.1 hypothetical protein SAMN05216565_1214 [Litchfieldia salsa]
MLYEIISGILQSIGQDSSLNTEKIDKNIKQLRKYEWFNGLYESETYRHLFFGNRKVRKYLQSSLTAKKMMRNQEAQEKFKQLLDKQEKDYQNALK